jgi:hypothetical protein
MNDLSIDIMRVPIPVPAIVPPVIGKRRLTYKMSKEALALDKDIRELLPSPLAIWEVDRPEFTIDESDLPY